MTKNKPVTTPLCFTLLLVILVLLPANLRAFKAGKLSFYITNDFLYRYNELSGEENQFYESLSIFSGYKKWSLGLTLRGNNFFKQTPNLTLENPRFDVYRKFIQYNSKHLEINLGDFYSLLGRGLVLSVLKNEDLLREKTIVGGDLHYNRGRFDLRVLGGRIKDETENQEWTAAGGEVIFEYAKNNKAGVHFCFIDDIDTLRQLGKRFSYSFSLKGNRLFKHLSYYTEMAFLDYRDKGIGKDDGYGIYSNITYSKSHVTCFLEFKRYKDLDNEMNNPPITDRVDEISTIKNTAGLRFYFQYNFFEPDITLFFNIGRYKEYDETGNHIYAGVSIEDFKDRLSLSASYGIRDIFYPIKRLEGNFIYQFSDRWSMELTIKDKRYSDEIFIFKEIDHTCQVSYSPYVSVFFMHQYSHNRIVNLNHFFSGGVKVYLSAGTAVELSGGTLRGGQICSGGQCFVAPPFKGVKFSFLHTFK